MKLQDEIEYDHEVVQPYWTLGDMIPIIERSVHSLFPVLDEAGVLLGVVDLQELREIMFDRALYDEIKVHEFMTLPQGVLDSQTKMEKVKSEKEKKKVKKKKKIVASKKKWVLGKNCSKKTKIAAATASNTTMVS